MTTAPRWSRCGNPPRQPEPQELRIHRIADCTGPQSDIARLESGLLKTLFDAGLISAPANRMGLRTGDDYTVLDLGGRRVEGLHAIGSLLKGRFYESVAVPELRVQAMRLTEVISARA